MNTATKGLAIDVLHCDELHPTVFAKVEDSTALSFRVATWHEPNRKAGPARLLVTWGVYTNPKDALVIRYGYGL